jgi:heme exporter protein A
VAGMTLEIDDVSRRYGPRWALAHVTARIAPGESWMLLGHNGSGKSTLLGCLATSLRTHHGQIRWGGADVWADRTAWRRTVGVFVHKLMLYDDLSAQENLTTWARLGGLEADVAGVLRRVGLDPDRHDPVRTFSAGMRRRAALARLLLKKPAVVLLDEPFTALDPAGRELLMGVIRELRDAGATVLMATHLPQVARAVAEHAMILERGRQVFVGPVASLPAGLQFE